MHKEFPKGEGSTIYVPSNHHKHPPDGNNINLCQFDCGGVIGQGAKDNFGLGFGNDNQQNEDGLDLFGWWDDEGFCKNSWSNIQITSFG